MYQRRKIVGVRSTTYTITGDLLHEHEDIGRVERAVRILGIRDGVREQLTNMVSKSPWKS